ncbi:CLASP_domain-containing protein [Hexamita inflata]|uniref:CLASP_domain-containing protein n=1 Tax=Hexamita inflata TaxID=28002 RepID=A0ABP1K162_9EUKA
MSKFASPDQNTRLKATSDLLLKIQTEPVQLSGISQEDLSGIIQNVSESNAKFQQQSIQVLNTLFQTLDQQEQEFQDIVNQDFNINFIISQSIQNMKSAKQQVRQDLIDLATSAAQNSIQFDSIVRETESVLKTSKNALQKVSVLQFVQNIAQYFDQKQNSKYIELAGALESDQSGDVRQAAQECIQTFENTSPVASKVPKTPKSVQSSKQLTKTSSQPLVIAKQKPGNSRDPLTYFPTPSESDINAQNSPFCIVPSIQQAYLPFKPIYLFDIVYKPNKELKQIEKMIHEGKQQQVKAQIQQFLTNQKALLENSAEWQVQFSCLQLIYQLLLVDNQFNNPEINVMVGQEICQCLNCPEINKVIQSPRSTLCREALIILEYVVQRYGQLCQQFVIPLLDTLLQLIGKKGVYYECQSTSLLKSIIIHCNLTKIIYPKLISQIKIAKIPSAKCYFFDLALTSLISLKLMNQFDVSYIQLISDNICQASTDANGRIRQTARVFINCIQYLNKSSFQALCQKLSPKDQQQLQLEPSFEAGFQKYSQKILCRVTEEYFPSFLVQAASCHQQIYPILNELPNWRLQLVLDDNFQLNWSDLAWNGLVDESMYSNWLGFGYGEQVQYSADQIIQESFRSEEVKTQIQKPLKPSKQQKSMLDEVEEDWQLNEIQTSKKAPYQFKAPILNDIVIEEEPDKVEDQEWIEEYDPIQPVISNNNSNYMQTVQHLLIEDENISDDVMEALVTPNKFNTAVNLKPQLIQQAIELASPEEDLEKVQDYLSNDDLSSEQIHVLVENILNVIRYQSEQTTLEMQNLLLQIYTLQQIDLQIINLSIPILVDLFNNEYLSVRRKSDEILRAVIEIWDPKTLFTCFQNIISSKSSLQLNINASVRLMTYVIRKFTQKSVLLKLIQSFVPQVINLFDSTDVNMRKTAVSCFIDMFMVIGQEFQVYVDGLGDLQLKLVIERMKQIQNKK